MINAIKNWRTLSEGRCGTTDIILTSYRIIIRINIETACSKIVIRNEYFFESVTTNAALSNHIHILSFRWQHYFHPSLCHMEYAHVAIMGDHTAYIHHCVFVFVEKCRTTRDVLHVRFFEVSKVFCVCVCSQFVKKKLRLNSTIPLKRTWSQTNQWKFDVHQKQLQKQFLYQKRWWTISLEQIDCQEWFWSLRNTRPAHMVSWKCNKLSIVRQNRKSTRIISDFKQKIVMSEKKRDGHKMTDALPLDDIVE